MYLQFIATDCSCKEWSDLTRIKTGTWCLENFNLLPKKFTNQIKVNKISSEVALKNKKCPRKRVNNCLG